MLRTYLRCVRNCRLRERAALLDQCRASDLSVILCEGDQAEPPRANWRRFLEMAAAEGEGYVLHLEDDAFLCPDFFNRLRPLLDRGSFNLLTLYSNHKRDMESLKAGKSLRRLTYSEFSGTVGFVIDACLAPLLLDSLPSWEAEHPEHRDACDYHLRDFLRQQRLIIQAAIPSLVQHRPGPSLLGHKGRWRHSRTFAVVFGDVTPC
jgi:hypothetical protein